MAIGGQIQTLLAPLVGGRCYPLTPQDGTETPYIIFQVITDVPVVSLDGPSGLSKILYQIDVWAETYTEQKTIETLVFSTMAASELSNVPIMASDQYEPETKLYRSLMEFSIGG